MARKKDFTNATEKVANNEIHTSIETATQDEKKLKPRRIPSPEEIQAAQEELRTTGLKRAGLPRINLAFSPSNFSYIHVMANATGMNLTQFVNVVIRQHREEHAELYEKAQFFRDQIKKGI